MEFLFISATVLLIFSTESLVSGDNVATYVHVLPSGKKLNCNLCKPGFHLERHCTETEQTICRQCDKDFYTENYNYIPQCLPCDFCLSEQIETRQCSSSQNRMCECQEGFYWYIYYCKKHSQCHKGQVITKRGTTNKDTVCESCPEGHYASGNKTCVPHTNCELGQRLLVHGNSYIDNVCATCDDITDRWISLIKPVLLEVISNHESRRLHRYFKRTLKRNSHGLRHVSNFDSFTQLVKQWLDKATADQLMNLSTNLDIADFSRLAEQVQHKMSRVKEESKLCNNNIMDVL